MAVVLGLVAFVGWSWQEPAPLGDGVPARLPLAEPGVEGSVLRLFRAAGGDRDAVDGWVARYRDGEPLLRLGEELVATPRFAKAYGGRPDPDFVDRIFQDVLGRRPSRAERTSWTTQLGAGTGRAALLVALSESPEYVARTRTAAPTPPRPLLAPPGIEHSVARVYLAFLGRWPDQATLDANVRQYLDGTPLAAIADTVLARPDAAPYGAADSEKFVDALYTGVLGRAPDPAGLTRSRARLDAGESRGAVAVEFTESAEMLSRTRTAVPLPAPIPHKLFAVGDSVMGGAVRDIAAIPGWEVHVDARACRQPLWRGDGCGAQDIPSGLDALRAARQNGWLGGVVVIQLGNNGPMSSEVFDAMMAEVADQRLVYALTLHEPRSFERPNNDVITQATARWPNLRILDWHSAAAPNPHYFGDAGIHLNATGARAFTSLITSALPQY